MSKRINRISSTVLGLLALTSAVNAQGSLTAKAGVVQPVGAAAESDRSRDGLTGPVRRVRTDTAKLLNQEGKTVESKRVTLETAAYDIKGTKTENQYFPVAGATLTGKEVYKYDQKGNISEMTMLNTDGSLLSKEVYGYEYDFAGNWNKMITSVAVIDGGKLKFEPTEITYRSITYYLDENMLKSMQANAATPSQPIPVNPAPANNASKVNTDAKTVEGQPSTSQPDSKKVSASLPSSTFSSSRMNSETAAEAKPLGVNADPHALLVDLDAEPPSSGPKPILKPVSGGVLNGTALFLPPPIYPDAAKRMRSTGVVTVEVVLDETGKVISAIATSGPTLLRETSMQAALKAKFSPTKLSGQPVKVSGVINYKFSLQ